MLDAIRTQLQGELDAIRGDGLFKEERAISSPQGAHVALADGRELLNLCANNYLGLADHPRCSPPRATRSTAGASAWPRCASSAARRRSTRELERAAQRLPRHRGHDPLQLVLRRQRRASSRRCSASEDAVISDALNHASIIDGIRLCKARRLRYANGDMDDLEQRLREAAGARRILIATDGVFSMDGYFAPLDEICDLADRYGAMVMVDDSHAAGFVGRDRPRHARARGVQDRVDIVTGTLGKALGGASGGFTSGRAEIVALLRQRSRPYLFSNSLAPPIAAASLAVLDLLELRRRAPRPAARQHRAVPRAR